MLGAVRRQAAQKHSVYMKCAQWMGEKENREREEKGLGVRLSSRAVHSAEPQILAPAERGRGGEGEETPRKERTYHVWPPLKRQHRGGRASSSDRLVSGGLSVEEMSAEPHEGLRRAAHRGREQCREARLSAWHTGGTEGQLAQGE